MKLLRHYAVALVLFAVLLALLINAYTDIGTAYDFNATDTKVTNFSGTPVNGTIADALAALPLIESVNQTSTEISNIAAGGSLFDIAGSLIALGTGAIRLLTDMMLLPYDITNTIFTYYGGGEIPSALAGLAILVFVYGMFIFLSAHIGKDV